MIFILLTVPFILCSAEKFGERIDHKNIIDVNNLIEDSEKFLNKEVTVRGKVEKICVKKGCWLNLKASEEVVRVTFKNYGIFVPSSFLGHKVALRGIFNIKEESVERQKHLLEDEGVSRKEIEKVTKPLKTYSIVSSGIEKL